MDVRSENEMSEKNSENDQTTEKLTRGLWGILSKLMSKVDNTIRDRIQAFMNGEEVG